MSIQIIKKRDQATGAFDFGRIQENKPVGFPHEGGRVPRPREARRQEEGRRCAAQGPGARALAAQQPRPQEPARHQRETGHDRPSRLGRRARTQQSAGWRTPLCTHGHCNDNKR